MPKRLYMWMFLVTLRLEDLILSSLICTFVILALDVHASLLFAIL